jgi:hypothetical protein
VTGHRDPAVVVAPGVRSGPPPSPGVVRPTLLLCLKGAVRGPPVHVARSRLNCLTRAARRRSLLLRGIGAGSVALMRPWRGAAVLVIRLGCRSIGAVVARTVAATARCCWAAPRPAGSRAGTRRCGDLRVKPLLERRASETCVRSGEKHTRLVGLPVDRIADCLNLQ